MSANGASGNCPRHRSRSAARSGSASVRAYAPAGPTPSVNGSHHSSKLRVLDRHRQLALLHLADARLLEQLAKVARARAGEAATRPRTPGSSSRAALPERRQRRPAAREVPDARRDDAVEPGHARHLGQAGDRIRHEVHDELRERGVEAAVRERQLVRRGEVNVDPGIPRPGRGDERLGGIDGRDRVGAEPAHELTRQRAGARADVEHRFLVADVGEVGQLRRERRRVPPHEAVVGVGGDVEAHCLTAVTLPAARHTIGRER